MKQILTAILAIPLALAVLALQLYFAPYAMVSRALSWHPAPKLPTLMFWLNLFFGWTLVGWLVLLCLALYVRGNYPRN
ncbi:hypothetical protein D0812_28600 [Vibrio owensii]|uniref:Superinfection immunity protein n=1 Tax=Vibrio owensii TaxID=696485 RepID=A0ABN5QFN8_9VIBR|nr:hypothetical protein D0812_28600 [Vibrio owensii]